MFTFASNNKKFNLSFISLWAKTYYRHIHRLHSLNTYDYDARQYNYCINNPVRLDGNTNIYVKVQYPTSKHKTNGGTKKWKGAYL